MRRPGPSSLFQGSRYRCTEPSASSWQASTAGKFAPFAPPSGAGSPRRGPLSAAEEPSCGAEPGIFRHAEQVRHLRRPSDRQHSCHDLRIRQDCGDIRISPRKPRQRAPGRSSFSQRMVRRLGPRTGPVATSSFATTLACPVIPGSSCRTRTSRSQRQIPESVFDVTACRTAEPALRRTPEGRPGHGHAT